MARIIPKRPDIAFPVIPTVSGTGTVALPAGDTTPDQFTFSDQIDVVLGATITSAPITISGLGVGQQATATVSGGLHSLNGGVFTSSPFLVSNTNQVRVQHTASGNNSTAVNTTETIGGISDVFTSITVTGVAAYAGLTPTKYVKSTASGGSDSANGNTEATAYATMAFALSQISAGQAVGVVTNISENIAWASISGGTSGSANHKKVVAKTAGLVITGSASGTRAAANLTFIDFQWNIGTGQFDAQNAQFIVFMRTGVTGGGGTSSGNVVQWVCGSNQAYHGCYADGTGGRYTYLAFQVSNVLFNECVIRTQANVWGPAASNPTAGITVYSCPSAVDLINCVAVDCQNQGNNAEWLGGFNFVSNVGAQAGVTARQCIAIDNTGLIGIQIDGSSADSVQFTDVCSVRNEYGAVCGTHLGGGSTVVFTRGEYSGNAQNGIADFGNANSSANQVNTTGNSAGNFNGISGSGNTTIALNMTNRIGSYKRFGTTYGLLRGETGWDVATNENIWDAFPNQALIRAKHAAISPRGYCGGSFTLTSYVKR